MKIVYIEDENGEVFSEDKKRRFTRLVGTEAYEYLKSAEGKNKVFFKTDTEEESGDLVLVEAPDNQKASVRSFLNHEYYVGSLQNESGYTTISICELETDDAELSGEEMIADESERTDLKAMNAISREELYRAVRSLSVEEREMIFHLYLSKPRMTERKLSEKLNMERSELHRWKKEILLKLKKLLGD